MLPSSVKTRHGAVCSPSGADLEQFCCILFRNESSEQLVEAFAENFSTDQLGMIVHVATDSPSEKLYTQLRVVCPKLGCVMLDPIPLAIVYEYGLWNKRSAGSKQLRRILSKCVATYPDTDSDWSLYYDGTMPRFSSDDTALLDGSA